MIRHQREELTVPPTANMPALTGARTRRGLLPLFSVSIFLSALLLFTVQPMFAKMVLPKLGGAPAVWSVAMVFFQAALLSGYAYAHWLSRKTIGLALAIHLTIMAVACFTLPIGVSIAFGAPPERFTAIWLMSLFAVSLGLPFFAVSANGPLLQNWFSRTDHHSSDDPYFLYGASNLGSFAALLVYPLLIEPSFGVRIQSACWSFGFVVLVTAIAACGLTALRSSSIADVAVGAREALSHVVIFRQKLTWIGLAFVPSALLLAVTQYLTTDVAAVPLLWVLPLALFLLTFVLTFQQRPLLDHLMMRQAAAILCPVMLLVVTCSIALPLAIALPLHIVTFFVAAMTCHGELVRRRPGVDRLTSFYFAMSLGGVLGGVFAALVAPNIFSTVAEYPLLLAASAAIAVGFPIDKTARKCDRIGWTWVATASGIAAVVSLMPLWGDSAVTFRSFFGVHKVTLAQDGHFRVLVHGTTIHGAQRITTDDGQPVVGKPEPLTYYWTGSPLVDALQSVRTARGGRLSSVKAIGLGTGSLACQAAPGEAWTYFEIDPQVVAIARNARFFRFLSECGPAVPINIGDARLTLASEPDGAASAIIVDAFSSDAIPVHLLTREAVALYVRKLDPAGIILFHVTNRHMDLAGVVGAVAHANGLVAYVRHGVPDDKQRQEFKAPSAVVAVARDARNLGPLSHNANWMSLDDVGIRPWTDDYSDILSAIWRNYIAPWPARNGTPTKGRWGCRSRHQLKRIGRRENLSLQDLYPPSPRRNGTAVKGRWGCPSCSTA
jgi:hypothetical protein